MFEIVVTKSAVKDFKRLDEFTKKRIISKLNELRANPFEFAMKLHNGDEVGQYRFRIGDYCVILDVDGKRIVVLRIGHRKEIYK
jgi:mRNA interferase RelE/StbE